MRKAAAIFAGLAMMVSSTIASLASQSMTLTTTIPGATYTLSIPESQDIKYGTSEVVIGKVSITSSSGFAEGKNLKLKISHTPFIHNTNGSSEIPYIVAVTAYSEKNPGSYYNSSNSFYFQGTGTSLRSVPSLVPSGGSTWNQECGTVKVVFDRSAWSAAPGDYTSTITFSTEIVDSEGNPTN